MNFFLPLLIFVTLAATILAAPRHKRINVAAPLNGVAALTMCPGDCRVEEPEISDKKEGFPYSIEDCSKFCEKYPFFGIYSDNSDKYSKLSICNCYSSCENTDSGSWFLLTEYYSRNGTCPTAKKNLRRG